MNCSSKRVLSLLVILLLAIGMLPFSAGAAEGIICNVEKEGSNVTISGNTFPGSLVSLMVTRVIDGSKSYLDQTKTGAQGDYSFSFALDGGEYRATVSCNGLHKQADIKINSSDTRTVTVRVEGENETKLPQTEVAILAGETTLLEAVTSALDGAGVQYEVTDGLMHTIDGEEGWQWMVDNRGGMTLPTTVLAGGEEIVLIDDMIWNPVLTGLTLAPDSVKVGEEFTVTLVKLADSTPLAGQPVVFNRVVETTDSAGQVTFIPSNKGSFSVTCAPLDASLIRPVPVLVNVTGGDEDSDTGTGKKKSGSTRREGAGRTVVPRRDNFDRTPDQEPAKDFTVEVPKPIFTDLQNYPWAQEAVQTLAGKGIINGRGNGLFDPGAGITRAEFVCIVTRMLKLKAPEDTPIPFKDVAGESWYYSAVAAAYAGGLINGVALDRFNPEGNISREEMAVIIAKVMRQKGYPAGNAQDLADFNDREQISSWAQEAATLTVREGIIKGNGGRFAPQDKATRAEAAVMLYRLYGLVVE